MLYPPSEAPQGQCVLRCRQPLAHAQLQLFVLSKPRDCLRTLQLRAPAARPAQIWDEKRPSIFLPGQDNVIVGSGGNFGSFRNERLITQLNCFRHSRRRGSIRGRRVKCVATRMAYLRPEFPEHVYPSICRQRDAAGFETHTD